MAVVEALKRVTGSDAATVANRNLVQPAAISATDVHRGALRTTATRPYIINDHRGISQPVVIDPASVTVNIVRDPTYGNVVPSDTSASEVAPSSAKQSVALASLNWQVKKQRRVACTCPNCKKGDKAGPDGRKIHVCHVPGCTREYGKTSHLRAHLRSHTGDKPFLCNWLFCKARYVGIVGIF